MITKTKITQIALATALVLGSAASRLAADNPAPVPAAAVPTESGHGLLGQNYLGVSYAYTEFTDTSVSGNTYGLTLNQGVREGLDTFLEYSYLQSTNTGFGRIDQQIFDVGARAFTNLNNGLKPFIEGGLGGLWIKTPELSHQHSFLFFGGAGVEIQATSELSFTPFARLSYANSVTNPKQWNYGLKTNYWFNDKVGLQGTLSRDNSRDMSYGLGVNFRY